MVTNSVKYADSISKEDWNIPVNSCEKWYLITMQQYLSSSRQVHIQINILIIMRDAITIVFFWK